MGSNWSGGAYPGADDYALQDTLASLSTSTVNDILAIRIDTANTGTLNVYPGADLLAIRGATEMMEESSVSLTCEASDSDGSIQTINPEWHVDFARARIDPETGDYRSDGPREAPDELVLEDLGTNQWYWIMISESNTTSGAWNNVHASWLHL